MIKKILLSCFLLVGATTLIQAQHEAEIVIEDEFYDNKPLNQVFDDLQKKFHFKMEYDADLLKRYRLTYWFTDIKLNKALKAVMKEFKDLRYFVDENNVIYVITKMEAITNNIPRSATNGESPIYAAPTQQANPEQTNPSVSPTTLTQPQNTTTTVMPNRVAAATPAKSFPTTAVLGNTRFNVKFFTHYKGAPTRFNFTITGKVLDVANAETLPFVTVRVRGSKTLITQSNVDGYFTLLKVPSDTVTLELSYVGYKNMTYYLSPKTPIDNTLIEMESATNELDEVVVTAQKTEVMKANEVTGMIKMTPKNIAKLPNVGERDPFRAFQLMPGVSASNESSSGLYVRGGTPDQTLVLYDGFTVYHVDHLFGFFSAFNYNAIKDIQLYRGGFDAKFGGRISGVAEITGKEGNRKELNVGGDISLLSTNVFVEAPISDKMTIIGAVRRSWKGPLYNLIFGKFRETNTSSSSSGFPTPPSGSGFGGNLSSSTTASSYFYDFNTKITFRPTKKDILALSIYNGEDNLDNSSSSSFGGLGGSGGGNLGSSNTDNSNWGNTGGSFKWSRYWSDKLYSNVLVSYSNYFSFRDNTRQINIKNNDGDRTIKFGSIEDNDLKDLTFKADIEYKLTPNHQLDFGTQITRNQIKYTYSQNDTVTILDKDSRGTLMTGYLQDHIKLLNGKLTFLPGIRYNYFTATQQSYVEPRISATMNFSPKLKLKAAGGVYYQFAKQINREDVSSGNRDFWLLSNDSNLPVTKSVHAIIGASYETDDYLFDVEAYQKQNTGVTEYTLRFTPQIGRGTTANESFYTGNETIRGVDFLIQKKFGNYNGWIAYTLSEAVRNIDAFSAKSYHSDQDVRHQLKIVNSYKWRRWDFAATFIYSSGRPYTSIVGGYDVTLLDGTTKDYTNPSDKNANRFPDYHRMDVSATFNASDHVSIGFSIFNLYGRTNTWYKKYEIITDNGTTYLQTTNVNYLGFTPNLTFSYKLH